MKIKVLGVRISAWNIAKGLVFSVLTIEARIVAISDLVKWADLNKWKTQAVFKYFFILPTINSTLLMASCLSVENNNHK